MATTDYTVLSVVALVGIVAVIAMLFSAGSLDRSASVTANVATQNAQPVPRSVEIRTFLPYDFNGDGVITVADSAALKQIVSVYKCPYKRKCDVNQDFVLDEQDVGAFNNYLLSQRGISAPVVKQEPTVRLVPQQVSSIATALA